MLTPDDELVRDMLTDPVSSARTLRGTHDAMLRGARSQGRVRSIIAESWQRSMAAEVDPDMSAAPIVYTKDDVASMRETHPLAAAIPTLEHTLVDIADSAQHAVFALDSHGVVLWSDGAANVRRSAEKVALVEGALCTEDTIGTTAVGMSLTLDRPTQLLSAEHLARAFHNWTCSASPLHDPDSDEMLGVIATGGPVATAHPSSAILVTTTARLIEHQLRIAMIERDAALRAAHVKHLAHLRGGGGALLSPTGRVLASEGADPLPERIPISVGRIPLGDGREGIIEPLAEGYLLRLARHPGHAPLPALSLALLGAAPPTAVVNGRRHVLTDRHAEVLALLTMHPTGLTSDQLTFHLYGDNGTLATTRAEIHRLRGQLGSILAPRPYRLRANVSADLLTVQTALRAGDVHRALANYRGSLLPRSESPTIRGERDELYAAVRRIALDHGSGDELWSLAETDLGRHDLEVLDAAHRAMRAEDPRRAIVAARAGRALTEE